MWQLQCIYYLAHYNHSGVTYDALQSKHTLHRIHSSCLYIYIYIYIYITCNLNIYIVTWIYLSLVVYFYLQNKVLIWTWIKYASHRLPMQYGFC